MDCILKPDGFSLRNLLPLREVMKRTHTHSQFERFKSIVREHSDTLIQDKTQEHQDTAAWNGFVNKVILLDARLARYDHFWPVGAYFDFCARRTKHKQYPTFTQAVGNENLAPPNPSQVSLRPTNTQSTGYSTVAYSSSQSSQRFYSNTVCTDSAFPGTKEILTVQKARIFIGRPPPGLVRHSNVRVEQPLSSISSLMNQPESRVLMRNADSHSRERNIPITSPQNEATTCTSVNSANVAEKVPDHANQVVVGCFRCGRMPTIPPERSRQLHTLVQDADHIMVLNRAGMVHDLHLQLLLKWKKDERQAFFDLIDTNEINPWNRMILAHKFMDGGNSTERNKRRPEETEDLSCNPSKHTRFSGIVEPSPEEAARITDPKTSIGLLQEAMDLKNNDHLFRDVINHIENLAYDYLSIFRPNKEQLNHVVNNISESRVIFQRYENNWVIKYYLQRRILKLGIQPIGVDATPYHASNAGPPEHTVYNNSGRSLPSVNINDLALPIIRYTCPVHPGVDLANVSTKLRRFLHSCGLAELIPAFAVVGILEDQPFIRFCEMSVLDRAKLFSDEQVVKLNPFQKMMMEVEFKGTKMLRFAEK